MPKINFILGSIFCCLGIFLSILGVISIYVQYESYVSLVPVQAVVESTDVKTRRHKGKHNTSYSYLPVIRYHYKVKGKEYVSDQYTPIPYSVSDYSQAKLIINNFKVGQTITAYINPKNPKEACLVKEYYFTPYFFALLGVLIFVIGSLTIFLGIRRIRPAKYMGNGWYGFSPIRPLSDKLRMAYFVALIWFAAGIGVLGHYFWSAPKPYSLDVYMLSGIYGILGLIAIGFCVYFRILQDRAAEPVLLAERDKFMRGEKVKVRIEQRVNKEMFVEELILTLVCVSYCKIRSGTQIEYKVIRTFEQSYSVLKNYRSNKLQPIGIDVEIDVPNCETPTSPKGYRGYPRYEWLIELCVKVKGAPDYHIQFPVIVE